MTSTLDLAGLACAVCGRGGNSEEVRLAAKASTALETKAGAKEYARSILGTKGLSLRVHDEHSPDCPRSLLVCFADVMMFSAVPGV